jgi:hypothetical protein
METVEMVYFTCLNKDCEKYRNVFTEGDPLHQNCARERLFQEEEQRGVPMWAWVAIPAVIFMVAAGVMALRRPRGNMNQQRTLYGEERPTQTWSGAESHLDEREGNRVPPPMS